jgi:hypothetical protein
MVSRDADLAIQYISEWLNAWLSLDMGEEVVDD